MPVSHPMLVGHTQRMWSITQKRLQEGPAHNVADRKISHLGCANVRHSEHEFQYAIPPRNNCRI